MHAHTRRTEKTPKTADADQVEFLVGFPCRRFNCTGRLSKGHHREYPAVVCSQCRHAYYLAGPPAERRR